MRQASRPPLARMLMIDQAVRSGRRPNATTLAATLEVDVRTVRRDIAYLRDRLGAPLEFDPRCNGFRYTRDSYRLPFFSITEGELVALLLAERLLTQYRGTPFEEDLRRVFHKLSELLPDSLTVRLDALGDCLAVLPAVETDYDPALFAALAKATVEGRRLEVVYRSAGRDAETTRVLDPYALLMRDESWFAVARDSLHGEVRVFALQRFRSARETGERFERPADFRVGDYMAGSFGVVRGEGVHRVELRFRPPGAQRIAEKRWHPGQTIEPLPDGGLVLRFEVSDLREVARFAMFWGDDCDVVSPKELVEMIRARCRSILGR